MTGTMATVLVTVMTAGAELSCAVLCCAVLCCAGADGTVDQ